jgi:RNA polymerase sigma factor (sigma-70 family)
MRSATPDTPTKAKEVSVKTPAAQAVEALIEQYGKLVFHTIYGLTGDWEESQDLTQDTFHLALKGIEAAQSASGDQFHAKAWLLRIALNTVRTQQRRRALFRFVPFSRLQEGRHTGHSGSGDDGDNTVSGELTERPAAVQPPGYASADVGNPAERIAEQDSVRRAIAALPEQLRTCLLLSIVGGLSTGEIAELLDLKEPAVRQRLSRARKQFQQAYQRESGEELFDGQASSPEPDARKHVKDEQQHSQHITHMSLSTAQGAPR